MKAGGVFAGALAQLWRPQVGCAGEGVAFRRERSSWLLSEVEQERFDVRVSGFTQRCARRVLVLGVPQGPAGLNWQNWGSRPRLQHYCFGSVCVGVATGWGHGVGAGVNGLFSEGLVLASLRRL